MTGIRVTIGVPTIGDNPFIWKALASARENLKSGDELVISDNESKIGDALADFARSSPFDVRLVRQAPRIGMADNWNQCLANARGQYFLLLCDDDVLLPGMIDALTAALDSDESAAFSYGRSQWIDEADRAFWTSPRAPRIESSRDTLAGVFARKRVVLPSATIYRRRDLAAIGGYDPAYGNWADMAVWIGVGSRYPHIVSGQVPSMQYRERRANLTRLASDAAWGEGIDRTLELIRSIYPADSRLLSAGATYKAYILADIRLKRLLSEEGSLWRLVIAAWKAARELPLRQRARLAMKSIYLRVFARLNDSK